MSGEDDDKELELKDLIIQTLESNGLLAKIKVIYLPNKMISKNSSKRILLKRLKFELQFLQL